VRLVGDPPALHPLTGALDGKESTLGRVVRAMAVCAHLDQVRDVHPRTPNGCEECLALGDSWVHLRLCMTCGHVGCCDSSKNKHASKHAFAIHHPIAASLEPGENWAWCYFDQVLLEAA
jgi:Zn-finger in ubiquitin-hydrolases and other protein